tara:strand:- start:45 stop:257 length:213 start_codon:yes stop_codon:yes gene_type:complete
MGIKIMKKKTNYIKFKNLTKIMQLPGTTMDKEAIKQMNRYAIRPENYLKDVNEMMSLLARESKWRKNEEK